MTPVRPPRDVARPRRGRGAAPRSSAGARGVRVARAARRAPRPPDHAGRRGRPARPAVARTDARGRVTVPAGPARAGPRRRAAARAPAHPAAHGRARAALCASRAGWRDATVVRAGARRSASSRPRPATARPGVDRRVESWSAAAGRVAPTSSRQRRGRDLAAGGQRVVAARRVAPRALSYTVQEVRAHGANVVHRNQQRFTPARRPRGRGPRPVLLRPGLRPRRALRPPRSRGGSCGSPTGTRTPPARRDGASCSGLARGELRGQRRRAGLSSARPVSLSRAQEVELRSSASSTSRVVGGWRSSPSACSLVAAAARSALAPRRRSRGAPTRGLAPEAPPARVGARRRAARSSAGPGARRRAGRRPPARGRAAAGPPPVLAYYYIWFNASSWNRAKHRLPAARALLERRAQRHAPAPPRGRKQAGISGFIVSWKSTPVLTAGCGRSSTSPPSEHFGLAIVYQGLDFHRHPQPPAQVADDLGCFASRLRRARRCAVPGQAARDLVGHLALLRRGRRARDGPASATASRCCAEREHAGPTSAWPTAVDGDAYYWSSADPDTSRTPASSTRWRGGPPPRGCGSRRRRPASTRALLGGTRSCRAGTATPCAASSRRRWPRRPDIARGHLVERVQREQPVEPSTRARRTPRSRCSPTCCTRRPPSVGDFDSSAPAGGGSAPTSCRRCAAAWSALLAAAACRCAAAGTPGDALRAERRAPTAAGERTWP